MLNFHRAKLLGIAFAMLALFAELGSGQDGKLPSRKNSVGMTMVRLQAGTFVMGSRDFTKLRNDHKFSIENKPGNETPEMKVKLSRDFEIAAHEVTVGQFKQFVAETGYQTEAEKKGGALVFDPTAKSEVNRFVRKKEHSWRDPGFEQADDFPVTCVSWSDARAFCDWLSKKEKKTYRLPSEVEWEYACRAGSTTWYCCGDNPSELYKYGNVADAALHQKYPKVVERQRVLDLKPGQGDGSVFTSKVGHYKPNAWGLYDMHGNVWEWTEDRYQQQRYKFLSDAHFKGKKRQWGKKAEIVDPKLPEATDSHKYGNWRSIRGGSYYVSPITSRSATRAFFDGDDGIQYIGFRVVCDVKK